MNKYFEDWCVAHLVEQRTTGSTVRQLMNSLYGINGGEPHIDMDKIRQHCCEGHILMDVEFEPGYMWVRLYHAETNLGKRFAVSSKETNWAYYIWSEVLRFEKEIRVAIARQDLKLIRKYMFENERKEKEMMKIRCTTKHKLEITKVIFNNPATIVMWSDNTKTVVKCGPEDEFDKEKGLAMAIVKKLMGTNASQSNYCDIFKKWIPEEESESLKYKEFGEAVESGITQALNKLGRNMFQ